MKIYKNVFKKIISLENLFSAWDKFKSDKQKKRDVQRFEWQLEENIFQLHCELKDKTYRHSYYTVFNICDPKLRRIHKACVRDRVLQHAIFRILYPIFDKGFIFDSYSCRLRKGTHRAVDRLEKFTRKLSRNNRKNIFALKCDIRKFFGSINQDILLEIIKKKIQDNDAIWLIERIIKSFKKEGERGLPLGNVTSQLFANIYLNEFDQFIKHRLGIKYYLRYCDDFVILWESRDYLDGIILLIRDFLKENLKLSLHTDKIIIRRYYQGIDFLGYVVLPHYRVLRTKTKKRMLQKIEKRRRNLQISEISEETFNRSLQSYFGVLKHCKGFKIKKQVLKMLK